MIPTAEEWLKHFEENAYPGTPISECMIEFAQMHVEAALKYASENAQRKKVYNGHSQRLFVKKVIDKNSILNAYSLTNIK